LEDEKGTLFLKVTHLVFPNKFNSPVAEFPVPTFFARIIDDLEALRVEFEAKT
jgi:hypothetical protein